MPIYVYRAKHEKEGCSYCKHGFELLQKITDEPLKKCPRCGADVEKAITGFSSGFSKTTLDSRAKQSGFHKLKRVDKGRYEKLY